MLGHHRWRRGLGMNADPNLLHHVERWRNEGIPPPPEVDPLAFAEALAMSAALSVALAAESEQALVASLHERLRFHDDSRGHSSSLRMRIAAAPRHRARRRPQRRAKPVLWLVPLGLAAAAVLVVLLWALPSAQTPRPPAPQVVEQAPAPQRQGLRETPLAEADPPPRPLPDPQRPSVDPHPQQLPPGTTELRPTDAAAHLVSGQHRIHVPAGSVVQVTESDGVMTAAVASGEALVEVEGHGPLRILANERVQIGADGVPIIDGGRVVLDLSAQPGRILGERRGNHWQARFDPEFGLMALDIERFAEPLPLRGDEWLQLEYRLAGRPEWFGVYLQVAEVGHSHWAQSWSVDALSGGWQSLRIAIADLQPDKHGLDGRLVLANGQLQQLRFQAGMSSDPTQPTVLELRSLRLMAPLRQ